MSEDFPKKDIQWLIVIAVLLVLLLCVSTYEFWPDWAQLFGDWPG